MKASWIRPTSAQPQKNHPNEKVKYIENMWERFFFQTAMVTLDFTDLGSLFLDQWD